MTADYATPLFSASAVSKTFGSFEALRPMDFSLRPGEVKGLVGSNGAGKSTLVKILTGAHAPSTGTVSMNGKGLPVNTTTAYLNAGIACIYQHSSLAPNLSVLDNIYLGRHQTNRFGIVNKKQQRLDGLALIAEHGIHVDLDMLVEDLPTVKQKEIEILKALALNAKVILMDEPTAWLSYVEVARLHSTIASLKARDVAIVYISHMMDEIFQVCDSISVLRDGSLVWNGLTSDTNRSSLVHHMLGETVGLSAEHTLSTTLTKKPWGNGTKKLAAQGMGRKGFFTDVSFDLYVGEIFCITGLIGAKRTELVRCLFGADQLDSGSITIDGQLADLRSPKHAIDLGIGFVPEDRHRDGLFLSHSIRENLPMAALNNVASGVLLRQGMMAQISDRQITSLNIVPNDSQCIVGGLSGGNQQKVLIAKWLETRPGIIILDEPTVGVDVGAKSEIYEILRQLRDKGVAILIVSSDIEEVQTIADRIGIMVSGRLTEVFDADSASHEQLVAKIIGGPEQA